MQKENEATETELKTKAKAADSKLEQQKTQVCIVKNVVQTISFGHRPNY